MRRKLNMRQLPDMREIVYQLLTGKLWGGRFLPQEEVERAAHEQSRAQRAPERAGGGRTRRRGLLLCAAIVPAAVATSCGGSSTAHASTERAPLVGVILLNRKNLNRELTLSSELVPFQEIDVYAKVAGYVKSLSVDYGTRVKTGQVMATLEIPELEMQIQQDTAAVQRVATQVVHAKRELVRYQAQHKVRDLEYQRLHQVSVARPGLVAQQEVDDAQGRDLESVAQVEAAEAAYDGAQNSLAAAEAKLERDKVLYDYSNIRAPFDGVVTQRYANFGTLVQAGTDSSTQAMPIVKLSEDNLFRLVIPVPESYVKYIRIGDHVKVNVPSLGRSFPGNVARLSYDVDEDTRTMHTEVDVPNPNHVLMPGLYAEATLALMRREHVLAVPLQALNQEGQETTVSVVNSDGRIENRPVTLGIQTPTDAEVVAGLQEGDKVVVSDRSNLKPGELVRSRPVELAVKIE
jgi:RND family efflux transporter MFP subunit